LERSDIEDIVGHCCDAAKKHQQLMNGWNRRAFEMPEARLFPYWFRRNLIATCSQEYRLFFDILAIPASQTFSNARLRVLIEVIKSRERMANLCFRSRLFPQRWIQSSVDLICAQIAHGRL